MGDDSIDERDGLSRKKDKDGFMKRKSLEEDTTRTPSRTESLTPTMARTLERRDTRDSFVMNVQDEDGATDGTSKQTSIATSSGKPNRKVRPTRTSSTRSFTQAAQAMRSGKSPTKKLSGDDSEDGAGPSASLSSNHSRSGLEASGSATLAHLPVSTDNLLHHLHTDPRSSHITLSASASAGSKVPLATLNPALLAAGGDPSGGKAAARSRAPSTSSRPEKDADGQASLPASRSVSKKPSFDTRISERRSEEEKASRDQASRRSSPGPRLGLSRSTSSAVSVNQVDLTASPSAEHNASSDYSQSALAPDPLESASYFHPRARASSSSDARSNGSRGFRSTASTPMEDWPSHDIAHDSTGGTNEGHPPEASTDLVGGGLAGTPRRGSEAEPQYRRLPQDDHVEMSPRTSGADGISDPKFKRDVYDSEPDSGLVAVTVSDSTAVKLETLVPGEVADKINQTDDPKGKQAMLDQVGGTSSESRPPPSSAKRSSDEPRGGLGFSNLDLSAANLATPPSEERIPKPAYEGDHPEFEVEGDVCIDEFSNMLAEAMRGTAGRRASTDSSAGGSVTSSRRGAKLIGTAGSLVDGKYLLLLPRRVLTPVSQIHPLGSVSTRKGSVEPWPANTPAKRIRNLPLMVND